MPRSVALLAEGVDRNYQKSGISHFTAPSPSSRRAWIEIFNAGPGKAPDEVALLAEGVDRNQLNR